MDECYINIRFGCYHFQLRKGFKFRVSYNDYHEKRKDIPNWKWFEIYTFFGLI